MFLLTYLIYYLLRTYLAPALKQKWQSRLERIQRLKITVSYIFLFLVNLKLLTTSETLILLSRVKLSIAAGTIAALWPPDGWWALLKRRIRGL